MSGEFNVNLDFFCSPKQLQLDKMVGEEQK